MLEMIEDDESSYNSTLLTSATRGETLTPNPNECNSTLTSVTRGTYPCPDTYIYKCSLVVWNLDSPRQFYAINECNEGRDANS